jgi:hypothetical protein
MAAGTFYARAMIHGLATCGAMRWAPRPWPITDRPGSLVLGAGAGAIVAVLAIALALRKQVRRPARDLLAGAGTGSSILDTWHQGQPLATRQTLARASSVCGAGFALALQALVRAETASAGTFFGAGALWLARW